MSGHRPPYSKEFRGEAVRLAKLGGKPQWKLAEELGVTAVTLRKWLRQDRVEEEARRDAEARACGGGGESVPAGAGGQLAVSPDLGVGAGPATVCRMPYRGLTVRPDRIGGSMSRADRGCGMVARRAD